MVKEKILTSAEALREAEVYAGQILGTVFWVNDGLAAHLIDSSKKAAPGWKTWLPFAYPLDKLKKIRDRRLHPDRILLGLRNDHGRHVFFPSKEKAGVSKEYDSSLVTDIVAKGAGLNTDTTSRDRDLGTPLVADAWYSFRNTRRDKESDVRGLCDISEAVQDRNMTLRFNALGGRFGIPISIATYDALPAPSQDRDDVYMLDMKELREEKLLPRLEHTDASGNQTATHREKDFTQAACYFKGYVLNARMDTAEKELKKILPHIIRTIQREDPAVVDTKTYLLWLARKQATNCAIIHAQGLINPEEGDRNMTLGGEMTDLSACRVPNATDYHDRMTHELEMMRNYFEGLLQRRLRITSAKFRETLLNTLRDTYATEFARVEGVLEQSRAAA